MNFKTYYRGLEQDDREAFADRAETSTNYIDIHLIPRHKIPRKESMKMLAKASEGAVSYLEIVDYFYNDDDQNKAA